VTIGDNGVTIANRNIVTDNPLNPQMNNDGGDVDDVLRPSQGTLSMGAVPTDYDAVVEELTAQVHAEPQERPLGNAAASETGTCRVRISEIVVPAIAAAPDDDIFDIDPEWRR
jgi:hypothetical protein